jgi:hypothetical protein
VSPIPRKIRSGWERRFPELIAPWTHWRILGDGAILADVSGDDLLGALAVVETNFGKFESIVVARLSLDASGHVARQDKGLFQISRHSYEKHGLSE